MSRQIACTRSTARAVVAFVSLVAIVAAVAAGNGRGFLEAAAARRATGTDRRENSRLNRTS